MKILVIARGYPSKKYPMNGIFEFDQAKALARLGYHVYFAAVDTRSIRRLRHFGFEKFKKDNVNVFTINLPIGRVPSWLLNYFTLLGLKILYNKIVKEEVVPDIMHSHFPRISLAASKLKNLIDLPLIITEHSSGMMAETLDVSLVQTASSAYENADSIIVVSPSLGQVLSDKFKKESTYIPNIVDTGVFKYIEKTKNPPFTFITVGTLITRKRMDLTIAAFHEAFQGHGDYKLLIIGAGPLDSQLKKQVFDLAIQEQVSFLGSLERKVIAHYMQQSDCFVLPSQAETFGVVYIEALASGLPVIATKCGGPETFVNEMNGILIDVDNKKELVSSMKYMSQNIQKYNKLLISNKIIEEFSPEVVARKIINEYKRILNKN